MVTQNNAKQLYKRIVRPIIPDYERVPYFEWRMNGFEGGAFNPLLEDSRLVKVLSEVSEKYPQSHGVFYGDNHGHRLFSLNGTREDISLSYLKNWQFDWDMHVTSRDETFYRETAEPDDCVELSISGRNHYLCDLASIESGVLFWHNTQREPVDKLGVDFTKINKRAKVDLSLKLLVMGVLASYKNDLSYQYMSGPIGATGLTGRRTDSYIYKFLANDGAEDRIIEQVKKMKKERRTFKIILFIPKKLEDQFEEQRKTGMTSGIPKRSPRTYCDGCI